MTCFDTLNILRTSSMEFNTIKFKYNSFVLSLYVKRKNQKPEALKGQARERREQRAPEPSRRRARRSQPTEGSSPKATPRQRRFSPILPFPLSPLHFTRIRTLLLHL